MMQRLADHLALIFLTAWVGALWAVGGLAAPTLFYQLENKVLAGVLAGQMFQSVAYLGMVASVYLLAHRLARSGARAMQQAFFWALVVMLLLTLAGHFGIHPLLAQIKAEAAASDVMHSVFADRFATWHGMASLAYLLECLLGLVLVLKK